MGYAVFPHTSFVCRGKIIINVNVGIGALETHHTTTGCFFVEIFSWILLNISKKKERECNEIEMVNGIFVGNGIFLTVCPCVCACVNGNCLPTKWFYWKFHIPGCFSLFSLQNYFFLKELEIFSFFSSWNWPIWPGVCALANLFCFLGTLDTKSK